jgi:probable rRNA maturation factor
MSGVTRDLSLSNRHPRLVLDLKRLAAAIASLDAAASRFKGGCPPGELSVAFLSDRALAKLHGEFLDDPTPTDVITFEGDPAVGVAGEICVSADAATRQAGRGQAFADELTLYVVHGWLHLAGYDDLKPLLKKEMRRAEARAMGLVRAGAGIPKLRLKRT